MTMQQQQQYDRVPDGTRLLHIWLCLDLQRRRCSPGARELILEGVAALKSRVKRHEHRRRLISCEGL